MSKKSEKSGKSRHTKPDKYRSFRLQKGIRHPVRLPGVRSITAEAARTLWRYRGLFLGITLIYGLLNLVLAQGLAGGADVSSLKESLGKVFSGHLGFLPTSLGVFVLMLGSAGNTTNQTAGTYQSILVIIASLAVIWTLRQVLSGSLPRIRDAYYQGMYPLVPFILVLAVVGLQLMPMVLGSTLYVTVVNSGIAVYAVEKILWALLFVVLALLSLYMLTSSLFALYIVTLPDMTPMKALRSARELVRYRRWTVLRKILWLPVVLMAAALLIMLPVIILVPPLAKWLFFLLTMAVLTAAHTYMYTLYREL
ncbi:MAG TPA: hypothetical protein VFX84_00595, partial [Candidatus Saccharimonadales bacterium]|nr:hypothetical protein [Candidatus Saccharimonadales bacterium]